MDIHEIAAMIEQQVYTVPENANGPTGGPEAEAFYAKVDSFEVDEDPREWPESVTVSAGGSIATYLYDLGERGLGVHDLGSGQTAVIPWPELREVR